MGSGKGGLKFGDRWMLRLELKGSQPPGKTRRFWRSLRALLKKHKGTITADRLVGRKAPRKRK
jgi:hypothetical protein